MRPLMVATSAYVAPLPAQAVPAQRCGPVRCGFGPSPKELSTDPSIPDVLVVVKAEQAARFARQNLGGAAFARTLPGVTRPLGFFDPLGLTPEAQDEIMVFREAEVMHGRVSMMAALGFLVQEAFHPIFATADGPAVNQLAQVLSTQDGQVGSVLLLFAIFCTEIGRARAGWDSPALATTSTGGLTMRALRPSYSPGALGFDPVGLSARLGEDEYRAMQSKELNNGRLAMVGVAGMAAQECVTGAPILS